MRLFALSLILLAAGTSYAGMASNPKIARIRQLAKRDATVIPVIAESLKDPDPAVRIEAVKAIVKIGTNASLDPLAEATHDTLPEVRIRATDGIVNVYLPGYVIKSSLSGYFTRGVRQMKSFFSARNDDVVDADVILRPNAAQAVADEINAGPDMDARSNAALAAGILRDDAAVPALEQGLRQKQNDMIFECLIALQKIQDPAAGSSLRFLARDLDDRTQSTALETIGVLHSLDAADDVRYALKNARNDRIRRAALEALAMLAIPGDRDTFKQYASDGDAETRAAALEGLGRIREPEDTPLLQSSYDEANADWRIHIAAAFGLVYEGKVDTGEFSPLPYLIEDLNVRKYQNVANAYLTELVKREDVRKSLVDTLPTANKDQKIALCAIFGASKNSDMLPVLTNLSRDNDADVAFAASKAIRILQARRTS